MRKILLGLLAPTEGSGTHTSAAPGPGASSTRVITSNVRQRPGVGANGVCCAWARPCTPSAAAAGNELPAARKFLRSIAICSIEVWTRRAGPAGRGLVAAAARRS